MRFEKTASTAWLLLVVMVMAVVAFGPSLLQDPTRNPSPTAAVTDLGRDGMLEGDMQMLERMRVTVIPNMNQMIELDPTWVDPEMLRAQEQYQAQIDRMLARR